MKVTRKILNWQIFVFFTMGIFITSFLFTNLATDAVEISSIEFIGQATLPKGLSFQKPK